MKKIIERYRSLPVQIKASLWFFVCAVLQRGISFITTPIFTRLMDTSEFGEFSVYISWQSVLAVFVTLNLAAGVFSQGLIKYSDLRERFSSSLIGLTTTIVLGCALIVYAPFAQFWNSIIKLSTTTMVCMFVSIWCNAMYAFWAEKQKSEYRYGGVVTLVISTSVAKPLLGILAVCLFPDMKVTARIISLAAVELVFFSWIFFTQLKNDKHIIDKSFWMYALRFNLPLLPHYLSQMVLNSSDKIMIERICSSEFAGLYSLAYALAMTILIVNTSVGSTLSPWLYRKIKTKNTQNVGKKIYIILIVYALVCLALIAMAPEAIYLLAPPEYKGAIWAIPPVAIGAYFILLYDLFAKFAFYFEKTVVLSISSIIGAAANIVLNLIFIPIFGYVAAAYTTLACYILYAVCHYIIMKCVCKRCCPEVANTYSLPILLLISAGLVVSGLSLVLVYNKVIIRYALVLAMFTAIICCRKKLMAAIRETKKN